MEYYKKHKIVILGGTIFILFVLGNIIFDRFSPKSNLDIIVNELTDTLWTDEGIAKKFGKITQVKVKDFILSPYHDTLRFSCQLNHIHNFKGIFIRHQKRIVFTNSKSEIE